MKVTFERISNGTKTDIAKSRSITSTADDIANEILGELKEKGDAIRSLARLAGANRKGVIVVYIPESVRYEVRQAFDLSKEPDEFVIQCKSGKDGDKEVTLVSVGFMFHSQLIDTLENWIIEEPVDGTEAHTVANSRKVDFALKQLADIVKDIRGRQK